jgi:hypothetical protein
MKFKSEPFLLLVVFIFVGVGCKAPRNNPSDPLNPDYNFGTIEGVVQSIGFPSFGLANVRVLWQNENLITESDVNGRFDLYSITIRDGNIIFSKEGYKPDTLEVQWGTSKRFFAQVFFNRIPTLDTVSIYTNVINQLGLGPVSTLFVKAWITDLDGDIDSVYVHNESLNLKKPLSEITLETTLTENELGVEDIEETIGLDFSIITKDRFDNEFAIGESRITRVIKNEVSGMHPSTDSIISFSSQPVVLRWNRFEAGYDFNYLIEVYSYTFSSSQRLHVMPGISSDSTRYTLPQNLSIGENYFWVIWVIDKFQNRSRSEQATFRIRN